jgi:hypothetical protein
MAGCHIEPRETRVGPWAKDFENSRKFPGGLSTTECHHWIVKVDPGAAVIKYQEALRLTKMRRSNSSSERPIPLVQTLGCTPRSGVRSTSKPPESLDFEERLLDEHKLRQHLDQLARLADDLEVTLKMTPQNPAQRVTLGDLVAPLVENRAFGGQVEYTYLGKRWLDTMIASRAGVRLVHLQLSS